MRTIHLTQSQAKCYLACRRKYFLEYEQCLKPIVVPSAMEKGMNYHSCIQKNINSSDAVTNAMYEAYKKYINLDILEHEKEFTLHLGYGVYYHGKVDGIIKDGIAEHKTAKIINDNFFFRLQADIQPSLYMLANNTNKCSYTVVQKPGIKIKQKETESEFFERIKHWYDDAELNEKKVFLKTEYRNESDLANSKKDFLRLGREIRANKIYPRNPLNCMILPCQYRSICLDYDKNMLNDSFYKKERVNEELDF